MCRTHFTILLLSSLMNEVVHTSPTIGSNVEEIVVKNTHFLMWDIGGQESLRSSWNTYYSNTEVSIFSDISLFTESQRYCPAAGVFLQSTYGSRGGPGQRSSFEQTCLPEKQKDRSGSEQEGVCGKRQPAHPSVPPFCGIFDTASAHV